MMIQCGEGPPFKSGGVLEGMEGDVGEAIGIGSIDVEHENEKNRGERTSVYRPF